MERVRVDLETGCWIWRGSISTTGYGDFPFKTGNSHSKQAHRFIWEHINGPAPDGHEIDHLCFNRICCNPEHLEAVTPQENVRRWRDSVRSRTHCPNGHEYTEANTYVYSGGRRDGARQCRTCRNEGMQRLGR